MRKELEEINIKDADVSNVDDVNGQEHQLNKKAQVAKESAAKVAHMIILAKLLKKLSGL